MDEGVTATLAEIPQEKSAKIIDLYSELIRRERAAPPLYSMRERDGLACRCGSEWFTFPPDTPISLNPDGSVRAYAADSLICTDCGEPLDLLSSVQTIP